MDHSKCTAGSTEGDVLIKLRGKDGHMPLVGVDPCIVDLLMALREAGIDTVASCCGHGKAPGSIILRDRYELIIVSGHEERAAIFKTLTQGIHDEERVRIPKKDHEELLSDQKLLHALQVAGVDNWEGYGYALESLEE